MTNKKITVFDFETSGLDPENDYILQVGVFRTFATGAEGKHTWYVNQPVSQEALDKRNSVEGLQPILKETLEKVGISPMDSITKLSNYFCNSDIILGYNIFNFDLKFYLAECLRLKFTPATTQAAFLDVGMCFKALLLGQVPIGPETHAQFARRISGIRAKGVYWNLNKARMHFDVKIDKESLHDAGADAQCTFEVYKKLINPFNLPNLWRSE